LALARDQGHLVTGSADGSVRLWTLLLSVTSRPIIIILSKQATHFNVDNFPFHLVFFVVYLQATEAGVEPSAPVASACTLVHTADRISCRHSRGCEQQLWCGAEQRC
jgi:hypothetical protein